MVTPRTSTASSTLVPPASFLASTTCTEGMAAVVGVPLMAPVTGSRTRPSGSGGVTVKADGRPPAMAGTFGPAG